VCEHKAYQTGDYSWNYKCGGYLAQNVSSSAVADGVLATAPILAPTVPVGPDQLKMPQMFFGIANHTSWIDVGGRGIDSAFVYGDANQGEAGAAVKNSGVPRDELFVISKISCCPSSFGDPICHDGSGRYMNAQDQLAHNMQILGLEKVDLMLMHWPCDSMDDTLNMYKALLQFKASGKARGVGVSNFNATMLENLVSKVSQEEKPAINQVGFSIGANVQEITSWGRDDVTVQKSKELGVMPMAYSPLGGFTQVNVLKDPTVMAVAKAHGKNTAQIALRWITQQGITVVTRSDNKDHDILDLESFDITLTEDEMTRLSGIHALSQTIQI
jgi:diketogulonate reductase-like aldo/keto reductase